VPLNGEHWRFSVIRWMPFGKAGGVTWGGKVHDTGNFGLVRFQPATPEQKLATNQRLLRIAWFKYLAESKAQSIFWSDPKIGDLEFYEQVLQPAITKFTAAGEALGDPDTWTEQSVSTGSKDLADWMEFRFKVAELRTEYLLNKRFADAE